MDCIKGKITGGTDATIWCSAAWNYEYVNLDLIFDLPVQTADTNNVATFQLNGIVTNDSKNVKGDLGFCCYKMSDITADV